MGRGLGAGRLGRKSDNGKYVGYFTDASGRRRERQLAGDRRTSERMLANLIRERDLVLAGLAVEEGQSGSLTELRDAYVGHLESHTTPKHAHRQAVALRQIVDALATKGVCTPRSLTPEHVDSYQVARVRGTKDATGDKEWSKKPVANRTANLEAQALSACLSWAVKRRRIGVNPLAGFEGLPKGTRHQTKRRRPFTDDELRSLFDTACDADKRRKSGSLRQAPLWLAFLTTGARFGALTQWQWGDLDLEKGSAIFEPETTKTDEARVLPLRPELVDELRALRREQASVLGRIPRQSDRVFLSPKGKELRYRNVYRSWVKLREAAEVPYRDARGRTVDIHTIRHTVATRLYEAGVSLAQMQKFLGHKDPRMTANVYTHADADSLRAAAAALPDVTRGPDESGTKRKASW